MPGDSAYIMLFYPYKHKSYRKMSCLNICAKISTKTAQKTCDKTSFASDASTVLAIHDSTFNF